MRRGRAAERGGAGGALGNVMAGLEFRGTPPPVARAHAEDWLRRVGLAAFGDRYPHQLREEVPKG